MLTPLTPLRSTGIYIVEVEMDANNFCIDPNDDSGSIEYYHGNNQEENFILLPEGNWQILGPITSDIISFDPAPYLEKGIGKIKNNTMYLKYNTVENFDGGGGKRSFTDSAAESLRSLFNSCGYYWVNPMQKPSKYDYMDGIVDEWKLTHDYNRWQSFESNLVTGILLALIKK